MGKLKVALTQMDIIWEDRPANYEIAKQMCQKAFQAGADLILFPEMSFTGFSMNMEHVAEKYPYESAAKMKLLSEKYPHMAIGFGYAGYVKGNISEEIRNCLEVVSDGESLMRYDKIHPFTFGEEGKHITAGSRLAACEIHGVPIGGFICYDLRFPEPFQISSKENALIFVIANWPQERAAHWKLLLQARAVENQCYIAGINRIGEGGGLSYEPGSMVFNPLGNPVKGRFYRVASEDGGCEGVRVEKGCCEIGKDEGFLLVEIDTEVVWNVRKNFPLKADRREALYKQWYMENQ